MKRAAVVMFAFALVMAACSGGGGDAECSEIVNDGLVFFQDVIDNLDGKSPSDLVGNPLEASDYAERANDLERRTSAARCTDEEIASALGGRIHELEAGDSNPTGRAFIAALAAAVDQGGFDFGG